MGMRQERKSFLYFALSITLVFISVSTVLSEEVLSLAFEAAAAAATAADAAYPPAVATATAAAAGAGAADALTAAAPLPDAYLDAYMRAAAAAAAAAAPDTAAADTAAAGQAAAADSAADAAAAFFDSSLSSPVFSSYHSFQGDCLQCTDTWGLREAKTNENEEERKAIELLSGK